MFKDYSLIYKKGFIVESTKKTLQSTNELIRPNLKSKIGPQDLAKLISKLYNK